MTVYLDESFAKVWVDETIPCVFSTITEPLNKSQLDIIAEIELQCLKKLKKKHTEVFSLVNLQHCLTSMEKAIVHYLNRTVRKQFYSGLTSKLLVSPTEKMTRASLMDAVRLYQDHKLEVFNSFEGALDAIKMHRAYRSYNSKFRKSFLSSLLEQLGFSTKNASTYIS